MSIDLTLVTDAGLLEREERCAKAAQGHADGVYALKIFESLCNDMLSALKMKFRDEAITKITESELEDKARASDEWKEFRAEQMNVLKEAGRKKIQYDAAYMRWESMRSRLSAKKGPF